MLSSSFSSISGQKIADPNILTFSYGKYNRIPVASPAKARFSWWSCLRPPFGCSYWLFKYPHMQEKNTIRYEPLGPCPQLDNVDHFSIYLYPSTIPRPNVVTKMVATSRKSLQVN